MHYPAHPPADSEDIRRAEFDPLCKGADSSASVTQNLENITFASSADIVVAEQSAVQFPKNLILCPTNPGSVASRASASETAPRSMGVAFCRIQS
jgi:hypothetical protein